MNKIISLVLLCPLIACDTDPVSYQRTQEKEEVNSELQQTSGEGESCVTQCVGSPGEKGRDGLPGIKGDKGDVGERGPAGVAGLDGLDGRDGIDGAPGVQGPAGRDGLNGAVGPKGDKGDRGEMGPAGKDGGSSIVGIIDVEFQHCWALPGLGCEAAVGVPLVVFQTLEFDSNGEYFQLDINGDGATYNQNMLSGVRFSGLYVEGARFPVGFLQQRPYAGSLYSSVIGGVFWLPQGHYKFEITTIPRMFQTGQYGGLQNPLNGEQININIKAVLKKLI